MSRGPTPACAESARPGPGDALARALARLAPAVARLPQFPPTAASAVALNVLLRDTLTDPALDTARGRVVRVAVTDLGLTLSYQLGARGITAASSAMPADVTISADRRTLWALASGAEDADMLFFSRRLVMSGDTELGLLIRNTLDAIDREQVLRARLPGPREFAAALQLALRGR